MTARNVGAAHERAARATGRAAGAGSPRTVIRGESPTVDSGVIVDWLRFTFLPVGAPSHALELLARYFALCFPVPVSLRHSKRGIHGYQTSQDVMAFIDGELVRLAIVAVGGDNVGGTMCVDISGTGCAVIDDWQAVFAMMQDLDANITRCDLAVDFLKGEWTVNQVQELYFAGRFNAGGRIPKYRSIESGDVNSPGCHGKTFEIGLRTSGKMVRAYEKGRQLGNQDSPWVRVEVELHNKHRKIPHEVVLKRDEYFAGAHKALEDFVQAAALKVPTLQRTYESQLAQKLRSLRNQYGKTIDEACKFYGSDYAAVVAEVRMTGVPASMHKVALARHVYGLHDPGPIDEGE